MMKEKALKGCFQTKKIFVVMLISILLVNASMTVNTPVNASTQVDLTEFEFTGNYSFENYDYNDEGKRDVLIVNMEINVITKGLISLNIFCIPFV